MTAIQRAIRLVVEAYVAAIRTLDANERDVLRDVIAARLAHDYVEAIGALDRSPGQAGGTAGSSGR